MLISERKLRACVTNVAVKSDVDGVEFYYGENVFCKISIFLMHNL